MLVYVTSAMIYDEYVIGKVYLHKRTAKRLIFDLLLF